jgi:hypothetical protein
MVLGSSEHLVAVVSRQSQLADGRVQPGVLPRETRFALALRRDFKGCRRMGQQRVAPLIILGLAEPMRVAELSHRLALQAFDDEHRCSFGVPLMALHG